MLSLTFNIDFNWDFPFFFNTFNSGSTLVNKGGFENGKAGLFERLKSSVFAGESRNKSLLAFFLMLLLFLLGIIT